VQNHISDNDIAIEFASFSDENTTTYIAYLLKKGYKTPAYKKILTHNNDENLNNSEIYLSAEFCKTLWGALKEELSGVENIYFAPTGELYNIAIESLPYWENPSMLVSDKWNFFRLSSTRELALNKERYNSKSATVYGGLKYDTATNQLGTTDEFNYNPLDVDAIGLRSGVEYLPGSHKEALLIDKLLKSNKVNDKLYLGEAGTETTLKALGGERVNMLHIATHGFYWSEREARRMDFQFLNNQNKNVEDKMLSRSGLLFAGANNILSGKEIPGNIDDGVLTAEEISRIDLRGLDLLVLSACQTALGEISGEGVFGLQRGFKKAGAQSILMSLWNVDDKATQLFMSKFYELLLADKDNPHNKRNAHLKAQQFVKNYEIDMNSISSHELEYYKENGAVINYNTGKVKPFCNHKFWAAFILLDAI
jgi:CHAT domain-containing protein